MKSTIEAKTKHAKKFSVNYWIQHVLNGAKPPKRDIYHLGRRDEKRAADRAVYYFETYGIQFEDSYWIAREEILHNRKAL